MGDPAGVGPEICLKFLASRGWDQRCIPLVFGDAGVLERVSASLGLDWHPDSVMPASSGTWRHANQPCIVDLDSLTADQVTPGNFDAVTGEAAWGYIQRAMDAALSQQVAAMVTAPINKAACHAAGIPYPGHTEMLAARTGATRTCMMLTSEALTCSLVTTHVGYQDVATHISTDRIVEVIELTAAAMRQLHRRPPRLAVCGLNPHAGEGGLFGNDEEGRIILPAIERARAAGLAIEGPLAADTAFLPQKRTTVDAYVCMYHDQGLIPLKTLAFDTAVNVTLGLPIIRTSVDHGTAGEIAWQGKAQFSSLSAAVDLAIRLV